MLVLAGRQSCCHSTSELKMPGDYRFCFTQVLGVIELMDREEAKKKLGVVRPAFTGGAGPIFNFLSEQVFHGNENYNWTAVTAHEFGSKFENGSYSGCMGSMMRNESDMTVAPIDYPIDNFESVVPYQVLFEAPVQILSPYIIKNESAVEVDFLGASMFTFGIDVWTATLLIFILGSFAFYIRKILLLSAQETGRNNSKHIADSLFDSFAHVMLMDFEDFSDAFGKITSITLTFAGFMLIQYWQNLMSTDLFIVAKPETIEDYNDILKRQGLHVHFLGQLTDYLEFRDAPNGTIQRLIWDTKQDTTGTVPTLFDATRNLISNVIKIMSKALEGKVAFLVSQFLMPAVVSTICKMKGGFSENENYRNIFPHVVTHPNAEKHLKFMTVRRGAEDNPVVASTLHRARFIVEMGFLEPLLRILQDGTNFEFGSSINQDIKRECVRLAYNMPERTDETVAMNIRHLKSVFMFCAVGLFIGIIAFVLEVIHHKRVVQRVAAKTREASIRLTRQAWMRVSNVNSSFGEVCSRVNRLFRNRIVDPNVVV